MADSKTVAEKFGKRHGDVLRTIETLDCSKDFGERNFASTSYTDNWNRQKPMYLMTRDGFVFLVMGFEGKRAAHWKEMYIHAFNAMEERVKQKAPERLYSNWGVSPRGLEFTLRASLQQQLCLITIPARNWDQLPASKIWLFSAPRFFATTVTTPGNPCVPWVKLRQFSRQFGF